MVGDLSEDLDVFCLFRVFVDFKEGGIILGRLGLLYVSDHSLKLLEELLLVSLFHQIDGLNPAHTMLMTPGQSVLLAKWPLLLPASWKHNEFLIINLLLLLLDILPTVILHTGDRITAVSECPTYCVTLLGYYRFLDLLQVGR